MRVLREFALMFVRVVLLFVYLFVWEQALLLFYKASYKAVMWYIANRFESAAGHLQDLLLHISKEF